jgi:hypothetical protein
MEEQCGLCNWNRIPVWIKIPLKTVRIGIISNVVEVKPLIYQRFEQQNTNHQQMHKESYIVNRNTLLHVSTLLGHLQGELFVTVTLGLHFIVEWECAVECVLRCFWRHELSAVPACTAGQCRPGPQRVHASSTQSTAQFHSTIKCNPSVRVTESSPWRWPSRVETCRSVLRLKI